VYAHIDTTTATRENYFWEPFESHPPLLHFDRSQFCALLAGRTIAMMGDSIQHQFFTHLQVLASDGLSPYVQKSGTNPQMLLGARVCEGSGSALHLAYNWMLNSQPVQCCPSYFPAGEFFHRLNNTRGPHPSFFIINRGAHYSPTVELLRDAAALVRSINSAYPNAVVMWRNTPVGHPNCSQYSVPIFSPLPMAGAPFNWDKFASQNTAVEDMLRLEFPDVVLLDVATATNLRPDIHASPKNNADCLHYRFHSPNVMNHWVWLFLNILLLAQGDGRVSSK